MFNTKCLVKVNSLDDWENLRPNWNGEGYGGFITDIPDLSKTPPVKLLCPPNKVEVLKRLDSEETRIGNLGKLHELKAFVEDIYMDQVKHCHWDVENDIEAKRTSSTELGVLQRPEEGVRTELEYEENTFVAVRQDEPGCYDPFWVGKISRVVRSSNGKAEALVVQWFEHAPGGDTFNSKYKPSNKTPHGRRFTSWTSEIDPRSVSVTFPRLVNRGYLCVDTKKKIRNSLGSG